MLGGLVFIFVWWTYFQFPSVSLFYVVMGSAKNDDVNFLLFFIDKIWPSIYT
jgi:hypothetical protein